MQQQCSNSVSATAAMQQQQQQSRSNSNAGATSKAATPQHQDQCSRGEGGGPAEGPSSAGVVSWRSGPLQQERVLWRRVMIWALELSVKTCCQLWENSDTPPVLKESDLHVRSEQNQQRIDTLIIQARRQCRHLRYQSNGHGQPCKAQTPGLGSRNAASSGSIESLCLHASLVHIECLAASRAEPAIWSAICWRSAAGRIATIAKTKIAIRTIPPVHITSPLEGGPGRSALEEGRSFIQAMCGAAWGPPAGCLDLGWSQRGAGLAWGGPAWMSSNVELGEWSGVGSVQRGGPQHRAFFPSPAQKFNVFPRGSSRGIFFTDLRGFTHLCGAVRLDVRLHRKPRLFR